MKTVFLIVAIILQVFYVWGIIALLMSFWNAAAIFFGDNASLLAGIISEGVIVSLLRTFIGLFGLVISFVMVRKMNSIPIWFHKVTVIFSYLWVLFFPIGTIIAVFQLKVLRAKNA